MAVQLTILRRRRKKQEPWRIGPDTTLPKRLYPYSSEKFTAQQQEAAKLVQRHYRGWRTRKFTDRLYRERAIISEQGFRDVVAMIARTNKGWVRFCGHVVLMGLMYGVVYFLLLQSSPSSFGLEQSLLKQYLTAQIDAGDFQQVTDIPSMQEFFRVVVTTLAKPDPNFQFSDVDTAFCGAFDAEACAAEDGEYFNEYRVKCARVTNGSGFFVAQNRIQVGLVVTQTRRAPVPCQTRDLPPSMFQNEFGEDYADQSANQLPCVSETEEQQLGQWIGEPQPDLDNNPASVLNSAFEDFQVILNLGLFNYDVDYNACRLQRLFDLGWLDYFTKDVCASVLVLNVNGNGRFGLLRQCFSVSTSGSVSAAVTTLGSVQSVEIGSELYQSTVFVVYILYSVAVAVGVYFFIRLVLKQLQCFGLKKVRRVGITSLVLNAFVTGSHILAIVVEAVSFELVVLLQQDLQNGVLDALTKVGELIALQKLLAQVYTFIFILMIFQAIILLDFLYDTGFISRTIYQASTDLTSFVFVFIFITIGYAYVGTVLYGSYGTVGFEGMWNSIFTLVFAAFGDFERVFDSVFNEVVAQQELIGPIFLWSYVFLTTLIMFNVLLSIIVEAFLAVQEGKRREGDISFLTSIVLLLQIHYYNFQHEYLPFLCCRSGPRAVSSVADHNNLAFYDELRYPQAKEIYADFLSKRHTFRKRLYLMESLCKQNIEQFLLRNELSDMVSDSLCSKLLYLTAENMRSFGDIGYATIEQSHHLPFQTLQKLELVLSRLEQTAGLEKRRNQLSHLEEADRDLSKPSVHLEAKLDEILAQLKTLQTGTTSAANGQDEILLSSHSLGETSRGPQESGRG